MTHLFTPIHQPSGQRLSLQLSDEDARKIGRGAPWSADVTDQDTGKRYHALGAPCSAGPRCFCDAVVTDAEPDPVAEQRRLDEATRKLVDRDVIYCVSSLVYGLSQAALSGEQCRTIGVDEDQLVDLWQRAPDVDSYRDALDPSDAERFDVHEAGEGIWIWRVLDVAGDVESEGEEDSELGAWRAAFESDNRDQPDGAEIYEHWIVSDWLGRKLTERGETVVGDVAGLTIWGRPTTGQAIAMDSVIEAIARETYLPRPLDEILTVEER